MLVGVSSCFRIFRVFAVRAVVGCVVAVLQPVIQRLELRGWLRGFPTPAVQSTLVCRAHTMLCPEVACIHHGCHFVCCWRFRFRFSLIFSDFQRRASVGIARVAYDSLLVHQVGEDITMACPVMLLLDIIISRGFNRRQVAEYHLKQK